MTFRWGKVPGFSYFYMCAFDPFYISLFFLMRAFFTGIYVTCGAVKIFNTITLCNVGDAFLKVEAVNTAVFYAFNYFIK